MPKMTPAVKAWLTKLRDEGPQPRPRFGASKCVKAFRAGWLTWADGRDGWDQITPAGRAALADTEPKGGA